MLELLQTVGLALVVILPLTNPFNSMVMFLALSRNMSPSQRRSQIAQTCVYVFLIMLVAFYGGQLVLETFGISIPGLRIAGGLVVGLIGLNMLFSPEDSNSDTEAAGKEAQIRTEGAPVNIALVPLAMPGTAGPGTIAMLVSTAAQIKSGTGVTPWVLAVAPTLAFLIVSLILWLCLHGSGHIMRWLGASGIAAISRLMGFLLVCMGTQFIINGATDIVSNLRLSGNING